MMFTVSRHLLALLTTFTLITLVHIGTAWAEKDLPWGPTQEPRTVTPDQNPLPPDELAPRPYRQSGRQRYERPRDEGPGQPYRLDPHHDGYSRYDRGPAYDGSYRRPPYAEPYGPPQNSYGTYSDNEIVQASHHFFGSVSSGLAKIIEYAFSQAGRPNGYILGEEAGGAFIAGLRYGEGTLYTKDAGEHRVFWQGPSIGYDFGAEGSKTMILVYNMHHPGDIYRTFSGVDGSAYLIGGIGITFQQHGHMTLAPIRAGIGVRLGANIGYLKYTRRPTWNPF